MTPLVGLLKNIFQNDIDRDIITQNNNSKISLFKINEAFGLIMHAEY